MAPGPRPPDHRSGARPRTGGLGDGSDHDRRGDARTDRRLRRVDEDEAPDVRRGDRAGRHDAQACAAGAHRRDRQRHRRRGGHRWRRGKHREPVDDGGDRRGRGGRAGDQARQSRGVIAVGRCRHARGVGRAHRSWARRSRPQRGRSGHRLRFRAAVSPVVSARLGGASRDRGADGLQSAWAADESGLTSGGAHRLRVGRAGRGDGRSVRHSPLQRARCARRRRPRRAHHHDDKHHLAGAGRDRREADLRPCGVRVQAGQYRRTRRWRRGIQCRRGAYRCWAGPRVRSATRWCSTRRARWWPTLG